MPASADLRGVEDAEVAADDLLGGVALDALGAGVPAHDVAARVEHEDRVVLDHFDEQPETLLALPQALDRCPLGGDVLHLQEQVQRPAPGVADRCEGGAHEAAVAGRGEPMLEVHDIHGPSPDVRQRGGHSPAAGP